MYQVGLCYSTVYNCDMFADNGDKCQVTAGDCQDSGG